MTSRILAFTLSMGVLFGGAALARETPVDAAQLQRIEDHSESLANQLHDLSLAVRERQIEKLAAHFSPALQATGWREQQGDGVQVVKWVYRKNIHKGPGGLDKAAFVDHWAQYLNGFSNIEDVRFKVKQAHFYEEVTTRADGAIYFAIVGRDGEGRRKWVEARAHITARLGAAGRWEIDLFDLKSMAARFAQVDIFSEVSLSAGVYRTVPPFGTPGNQAFVAHGVAAADVDRDGLLDVLATGTGQNFLYLNQGDGKFAERAEATGLRYTPLATAPLFLDFDADGDSDLFLAAVGHQMLFENRLVPDGVLNFVDISEEAGVSYPAQGFSAVSADVNGDGWPDIYVASYNQYGTIMPDSWSRATNGTPNLLFVNQGNGRFVERAAARGVADRRWSYAAQFGDLNGDGRQDLYVANDFGENGFYLNEGERFRDAAAELGLSDPGNGMGVSFGDYDNDGLLDIHVTNMSSTAGNRILKRLFPDADAEPDDARVLHKLAAGNTVFKNLGGGKFQDVSAALGPFSAGWAFGGGFVDIDNDGWEDIHAPNGFISGKSLKDT
jgi:hypothetical protein